MLKQVLGTLAAGAMVGIAGAAQAADLPVKAPAPPPLGWNGFYAGLNAGYGWGSGATDLVAFVPNLFIAAQTFGVLPTSLNPHTDGFIGGVQLGYNWRRDRTVVGLEADIAYSGMKGDALYSTNVGGPWAPTTTVQSNQINWLGTLRPRLGWLWTPSTLVYASGGLAYGGVKAETNIVVEPAGTCPAANGFCSTGSLSETRVGWTVGGGFETLAGGNWSVKMDYLYFDLGRASYPVISTATFGVGGTEVMRPEARFNGHLLRVGLNYHFH